jgi:2,3-bisphosphoglycerate-dependent phosphoglycerate mutase
MTKLILLRHGQSLWNEKNLFTGWVDIPLSVQGIKEAEEAAQIIKNIPIDVVFTSPLIRSVMTAMLVLAHHTSGKVPVIMHEKGKLCEWGTIYSEKTKAATIPVYQSEALCERMYGSLQGLNKQETREEYGENQVKIWRRSYRTAPPEGESLEMTVQRTLPYFDAYILPHLKNGKNVFISAHGNSLRSIIKELDNLSDEEIVHLELATGVPVIYNFENNQFRRETTG